MTENLQTFTGTFYSTVYPMGISRGSIWAKINQEMSRATFMIEYTGTYSHGARKVISTEVTDYLGNPTGQGETVVYSFKGCSGTQTINFQVTKMTENKIDGVYTTVNPGDEGNFSLSRGPLSEPFVERPASAPLCVIM